jgi:hypothetical protein
MTKLTGKIRNAPTVGLAPPPGINMIDDGQSQMSHVGHEYSPGMFAAQPTKNTIGAIALTTDMTTMRPKVTVID